MPDPSLLFEYTFHTGMNNHYMCKTCGVEVNERAEAFEKGAAQGSDVPFTYGLNGALLNDMGEYIGDFHGMKEEKGKRMKGMNRWEGDRLEEPRYQLKLEA